MYVGAIIYLARSPVQVVAAINNNREIGNSSKRSTFGEFVEFVQRPRLTDRREPNFW